MAIPGRVEEGLIQHRYGYSSDLPDFLEEAEIAMTIDTGGVFIGAPMFKPLDGRERYYSNIYPYHNIEILTEVSNNAEIIRVPFNPFNNSLDMPIIFYAPYEPSDLTPTDYISVHGVKVSINASDETLDSMVKTINAILSSNGYKNINFDTFDGKFKITFYSSNNDTLVLDSLTDQALQHFGFINKEERNITHKVITPTGLSTRTIGEILSDNASIKTFGAVNNNTENCAVVTNAAISILYRSSQKYMKKDLVYPAGQYVYSNDSIWLTSNAKLVGENITELLFKSNDIKQMVSNTDLNGYYPHQDKYASEFQTIDNIKLHNLNFISDLSLNGIVLYGINGFELKDSSVKSNKCSKLVSISTLNQLNQVSDIVIDNVTLESGEYGISIHGNIDKKVNNVVIRNVKFKDISDYCIDIENCDSVVIEHCDFTDADITGKFFNIVECNNVVIKDCSYPLEFNLAYGTNNKLFAVKSIVHIEDYIYQYFSNTELPNKLMPVVVWSDTVSRYNLKLDYDLLLTDHKNRSGVVNVYNLSDQAVTNRIDDSNDTDSNIIFNMSYTDSHLNVYMSYDKGSDTVESLRYKFTITDLDVLNTLYQSVDNSGWVIINPPVETKYRLTINPTPSDSTVTFSTGEVSGNTCTVASGTSVTYTVSKTGYTTVSNTVSVNTNRTINVNLYEDTPPSPTPSTKSLVKKSTISLNSDFNSVDRGDNKQLLFNNDTNKFEIIYANGKSESADGINWVSTLDSFDFQIIRHNSNLIAFSNHHYYVFYSNGLVVTDNIFDHAILKPTILKPKELIPSWLVNDGISVYNDNIIVWSGSDSYIFSDDGGETFTPKENNYGRYTTFYLSADDGFYYYRNVAHAFGKLIKEDDSRVILNSIVPHEYNNKTISWYRGSYANGKIILVGESTSNYNKNYIIYSEDKGKTWSEIQENTFNKNLDIFESTTTKNFRNLSPIIYGNNKYITTQFGQIIYSEDLTNWTILNNVNTLSTSMTSTNSLLVINDSKVVKIHDYSGIILPNICENMNQITETIIFGNNTENYLYYFNNSYFVMSSYGAIYRSSDLVNWNCVYKCACTHSHHEIACSENLCILWNRSKIEITTDGDNYEKYNIPEILQPMKNYDCYITYNKNLNKFIIISDNGYYSTTEDGITWTTPEYSEEFSNIYPPTFFTMIDNYYFIINPTKYYSTDLIHWIKLESSAIRSVLNTTYNDHLCVLRNNNIDLYKIE